MMVNKVPKLACKTFLREYPQGMDIEALGNFPIERDLVVDMTHFIESPEAIKPYIIGNDRKPSEGPNNQTRDRWQNTISSPAALTAVCATRPVRSLV